MRWLIAGGIVVLLLLWFGIPALTSRSPFVSASNAFGSGRRLQSDRVFGTVDRFLDLYATPLEFAALLSLLWAALRRDLTVLLLAAGAAGLGGGRDRLLAPRMAGAGSLHVRRRRPWWW